MSHFKPDLFKELSNKGFALDTPSSPMDLKKDVDKVPANPKIVVNAIQEYSKGMSSSEKHLYDYAKLTIATSRNIYDPAHLMNSWFEYFLQTYKNIYPELDIKELEKCMDCVEDRLLEMSRKVEPKDQDLMIPVLLGFLEKMI
jgi:hypothetical protein